MTDTDLLDGFEKHAPDISVCVAYIAVRCDNVLGSLQDHRPHADSGDAKREAVEITAKTGVPTYVQSVCVREENLRWTLEREVSGRRLIGS